MAEEKVRVTTSEWIIRQTVNATRSATVAGLDAALFGGISLVQDVFPDRVVVGAIILIDLRVSGILVAELLHLICGPRARVFVHRGRRIRVRSEPLL